MYLHSRLFQGRCLVAAVTMLLISAAQLAHAQTWVNNLQGPALREILTIDATGETNWLWGAEDVDGQPGFPPAEQAIDARTVYVNTDANRFYSRVYFSIANGPPGEVTTYVFVDADQSNTTGGSAAASELDSNFTTDPTDGGYDFVIATQRASDGTTTGTVYQYDPASQLFQIRSAQPTQFAVESGQFLDPIRINQNVHGYIQSAVDLFLVNLTQACQANIFVRTTVNPDAGLGAGDLVVGDKAACVPTFTNEIPTIIARPPQGCTSNAECPNNGVCINGACSLAALCAVDADCEADQMCTDARCVYRGGNACVTDVDCLGLLCRQRVCVACATDADCGRGMVCASDGRCLNVQGGTATLTSTATSTSTATATAKAGVALAPGEKLQGGACACSAVGAHGRGWLGAAGLFGLLVILGRRITRERNR